MEVFILVLTNKIDKKMKEEKISTEALPKYLEINEKNKYSQRGRISILKTKKNKMKKNAKN